ncbi:hypothetical protein BDD12DRAFT_376489 [Trichophaea hybrida]|nr:hypothetical protein BDD12DRAFT_376489 [Trichophaea hybrida]
MAGNFAPSVNRPNISVPGRKVSIKKNSKFSRLSQLRTVNNGRPVGSTPGKFEVSGPLDVLDTSPVDWTPLRLMTRDLLPEPIPTASPQSCITDAFSADADWSTVKDGASEVSFYQKDKNDVEGEWLTYQSSCADTYEDGIDRNTEPLSGCGIITATTWDGVTIIDDTSEAPDMIQPCLENCSQEDYGKEVVFTPELPLVSCRIESVITLDDFPEFMPIDDDNEEEEEEGYVHRSQRDTITLSHRSTSRSMETNSHTTVPERKATDPLSISREVMAQEWTETPPMKLDMAKLESIGLPPPRMAAAAPPVNRGMNSSPLSWLSSSRSSRSVSPRPQPPANVGKYRKSPEPMERSRRPSGWKLW